MPPKPKRPKKQNKGQGKFVSAQRKALKQTGINSTLAVPSKQSLPLDVTSGRQFQRVGTFNEPSPEVTSVIRETRSPTILKQPSISRTRGSGDLSLFGQQNVRTFDEERAQRKRLCRVRVVKGKKITVCKDKKSKKKKSKPKSKQEDFFRSFL